MKIKTIPPWHDFPRLLVCVFTHLLCLRSNFVNPCNSLLMETFHNFKIESSCFPDIKQRLTLSKQCGAKTPDNHMFELRRDFNGEFTIRLWLLCYLKKKKERDTSSETIYTAKHVTAVSIPVTESITDWRAAGLEHSSCLIEKQTKLPNRLHRAEEWKHKYLWTQSQNNSSISLICIFLLKSVGFLSFSPDVFISFQIHGLDLPSFSFTRTSGSGAVTEKLLMPGYT